MNEGTWKSLHMQTNCVIKVSIKGHWDLAIIPIAGRKYRIFNGGKTLQTFVATNKYNQKWINTAECESCAFIKFNCTCCGAPLTAREYLVPRTNRFSNLLLWHEFAEHGVCSLFDRRVLFHAKQSDGELGPEDLKRIAMAPTDDWTDMVEIANRWRFVK